ncbi:hypothetical protein [Mycolicibacterium cosmeticum]|uniref:Transmembrane protein n=1 Tax=Mycolicibacterium cosmeticum TaxID=258533 RepID=W9AJE2_MYCCO|nr:hypothetical protein [Mycolicibacterium cosmeticum]CDO05849.1 hypothetical protein BN977_00625 [Mycolicibacterium cosmeticum]
MTSEITHGTTSSTLRRTQNTTQWALLWILMRGLDIALVTGFVGLVVWGLRQL